jgi:2-polyprenyl-3-methyl-5-hydroxy-6-metoxy-1,4-benzoquinol methylase
MYKEYIKNRAYYESSRPEMIKFIPPMCTRILDVGCGSGEFGAYLKRERAVVVDGVELCTQVAIKAQSKLDKIFIGSIEEILLSLPQDYYDCVIFNDVLEHLMDPWDVLFKIKRNIKKGAYVVASIPNFRYYYNMYDIVIKKQFNYADEGILDKTHIRFFTKQSIINMLESSGYSVEAMNGIHSCNMHFMLRIINRLCNRCFDDMRYQRFSCRAINI